MGFWGTYVLARSAGLLATEDAVLGFGYQHEAVYELDEQWQLLETRGVPDPPDFVEASERFVAGTATAVLAAYVCNSDCLGVYARTPDGWTTSFHLPAAAASCPYLHRPQPAPRTTAAVATDLERWARAAGLTPVPERIRALLGQDDDDHRFAGAADELPFYLLPALGLPDAGEPHPHAFDLDEPPYCAVVGFLGIARRARNRIAERAHRQPHDGPTEREQPWEAPAIHLEAELWAALHRPDTNTAALRDRLEQLCAAYQTAQDRQPPRWRT